ncbi:alpha-hydroxy-acid oxidizing protein [Mesorhizobium sp. CA13]|nr:alpha-hydroxy-acid oxidizing protein [Mesorhizobium sp. CA13]
MARRRLPPALFHYVAGASEDEVTAERNGSSYRDYAFLPRVLRDVSSRSLAKSLFGVEYKLPFGIAPMGFTRIIAADGDVAFARASQRAGIPFILSGASLTAMETVRQAGSSTWFQAYVPGERDRIGALVERVEAAGFDTLVITADTAVHPKHERAARYGFRSPVRPSPFLAWQGLSRPGWLWRTLLRDRMKGTKFCFENMDAGRGPPVFSSTLVRDIGRRDALSWTHVEEVRKRWKGKLLIKGIMSGEDAAIAEKSGVDGIIVSNHGGRQVDCAASSLDALLRIAQRGLSLVLMLDGGIRRGSDVLTALRLGADFVFVGRPMLFAAAIGGEQGIREAISLLAGEIDIATALLGATDIDALRKVELVHARRMAA